MATKWRGWEYCDTSLTRVSATARVVFLQIRQFKEYLEHHRVVKIVHMTPAEMKAASSKLMRLENVKGITSTSITVKNGMWKVLVSNSILTTELMTIDSIIEQHMIEDPERPHIKPPFCPSDPQDHMPNEYLAKLKHQYGTPAPAPKQNAWKPMNTINTTG